MGDYSSGGWGCQRDYHPSDCTCKDCERPACFPYATLIDTPLGKVKIGELKKGQIILSYNAGKLVPRVITRKQVWGATPITRVDFENGKKLFATSHHSFLTGNGWKKLCDIQQGVTIIQADARHATVKKITLENAELVYNIFTADEHNFIADDCVAHNFTEFRWVRTLMHRILLDPLTQREMAFA